MAPAAKRSVRGVRGPALCVLRIRAVSGGAGGKKPGAKANIAATPGTPGKWWQQESVGQFPCAAAAGGNTWRQRSGTMRVWEENATLINNQHRFHRAEIVWRPG